MSSAPGLRVEQVHVWRGERHVLKGVTFSVEPGELLQVSGLNGTGKTTLLRVAAGLLVPEGGEVRWAGRVIEKSRSAYQSAMAYASHEPALKSDLTALENLHFLVGLKRRTSDRELRSLLARSGVDECADLPVRVLSAGQRRRVAMARVLAHRASLWLLDEPYTNLDAAGSILMSSLLDEHVASGGMAVAAAHHEIGVADTRHLSLAS